MNIVTKYISSLLGCIIYGETDFSKARNSVDYIFCPVFLSPDFHDQNEKKLSSDGLHYYWDGQLHTPKPLSTLFNEERQLDYI